MERGDSTTNLKKRKHFSQGIKKGFINNTLNRFWFNDFNLWCILHVSHDSNPHNCLLLPCLSCQWKVIWPTKKYTWPGLKAGILWALNLPTGDYWLKEFNKLASISSGCIEKIHTIYRNNQILSGGWMYVVQVKFNTRHHLLTSSLHH